MTIVERRLSQFAKRAIALADGRDLEIFDKDGERYVVEFVSGPGFLSVFLRWHEIRIAHAHLSLRGGDAELGDICVNNDVVTKYSWWRQVFRCVRIRGFRSKGLGTQLLALTLETAKRQGLKRIVGQMHGDLARLTPWYQSFGFAILPDSNFIELHLTSGQAESL